MKILKLKQGVDRQLKQQHTVFGQTVDIVFFKLFIEDQRGCISGMLHIQKYAMKNNLQFYVEIAFHEA